MPRWRTVFIRVCRCRRMIQTGFENKFHLATAQGSHRSPRKIGPTAVSLAIPMPTPQFVGPTRLSGQPSGNDAIVPRRKNGGNHVFHGMSSRCGTNTKHQTQAKPNHNDGPNGAGKDFVALQVQTKRCFGMLIITRRDGTIGFIQSTIKGGFFVMRIFRTRTNAGLDRGGAGDNRIVAAVAVLVVVESDTTRSGTRSMSMQWVVGNQKRGLRSRNCHFRWSAGVLVHPHGHGIFPRRSFDSSHVRIVVLIIAAGAVAW